MSRLDSATTATVAFLTGGLVIALAGCAELGDLARQQHEEAFGTYGVAASDWVGVDIPGWIPDDATDLRNVASLDETIAVVRVVTDSGLSGDCEPAAREGIPLLSVDWSVEKWPDEVWACGDYEVMAVEDGWLGWFQAAEPGQTPS